MARQTIATKYQASDAARGIRRRLLTFKMDTKEIYYNVHSSPQESQQVRSPDQTASSSATGAPMAPGISNLSVTKTPAVHRRVDERPLVPDAAITAEEIVRTIIANSLKKPINDVSLSCTINSLAGGPFFLASYCHSHKIELTRIFHRQINPSE